MPPPIGTDEVIEADRLSDLLAALNVPQAELARRLGVNVGTVNRWCAGALPIRKLTWWAITAALGVPYGWRKTWRYVLDCCECGHHEWGPRR